MKRQLEAQRRKLSATRQQLTLTQRHRRQGTLLRKDKATQYDFYKSINTQTSFRSISPPSLRLGTFTVARPRFPVDFLPRIESPESNPETVPSYIIPITDRATPKTAVRRGRITPRGRSHPVRNVGGLGNCRREIPPTRGYLVRPRSPVFSPTSLSSGRAVLTFSTDDEDDENNNPILSLTRGRTVQVEQDKNGLVTRDTFLTNKPSYFFRTPKNFREMKIIQNQRKAEAEANIHKSKLLPINRDVLLDPRWENNFYEHIERVENAKSKVCSRSEPVQKAKIEETVRNKELSKKKEKQALLKELEMQNRIQSERLRHIAERVPKLEQGVIKRPDKVEVQKNEREKRLSLKKQNQMLAERLSRVKPVITTQKVAKAEISPRADPEVEPENDEYDSPFEVVLTESESDLESVHSDVQCDNYEADDENY